MNFYEQIEFLLFYFILDQKPLKVYVWHYVLLLNYIKEHLLLGRDIT